MVMRETTGHAGGTGIVVAEQLQTLILLCPVCRSDSGDTLGVTGPLQESQYASVAMRCDECGTAYLSPPLPRCDDLGPDSMLSPSRLRRLMDKSAASSRTLHMNGLACVPESGLYELILITRKLEQAVDPSELLRHACRLLSERGRAIVIVGNAGSSCFAVFGGRHWHGYQLAGTRQQLTQESLRRLSANAGLRIERLNTRFASHAWLQSTAYWLRDWGASRFLTGLITGRWLLPQAVAALLEGLAVARGRGTLLVAELSRT